MEYNFENVGKKISGERKRKKKDGDHWMSQDALIDEIMKIDKDFRMTRAKLSKIEQGKELPPLSFLVDISKVFNKDIGYFLCEYDESSRNIHDIHEQTGLSELSINKLGENKKCALAANILIESKGFSKFSDAVQKFGVLSHNYEKCAADIFESTNLSIAGCDTEQRIISDYNTVFMSKSECERYLRDADRFIENAIDEHYGLSNQYDDAIKIIKESQDKLLRHGENIDNGLKEWVEWHLQD